MLNLVPCPPAHETPVKRKDNHEHHTADSEQPPTPPAHSASRSLEEVEARDLFEKFEQVVVVSEEEVGEELEEDVARRLDYEFPRAVRLNFDTHSSMKKKPRATLMRPFPAINLFPVARSPSPLQGDCASPVRGGRTAGAWVELAARKEREEEE